MKRAWAILCLAVLILPMPLFFGGSQPLDAIPSETAKETEPEGTKREETVDIQSYPYDLSQYVTLPSPFGVAAAFEDPEICTPEELEEAVDQIRLSVASFQPKEGKVQRFDKVTLSFQVMLEGQELAEMSRESLDIVVGQAGIDGEKEALGQALLGAGTGELRWADYTYPESPLSGELAGKTVIVKGTVQNIQQAVLPVVDLDFVQSMQGFEKATVEDFYASVEEAVLEQKEADRISAVWVAFCQGVTVLDYPKAELEAYQEDYLAYYSSFAQALEMELDAFLAEYMETDRESFDREMQLYAREMVKNDMIFSQLIRTLEITLTPEEYRQGLKEYFEKDEAGLPGIEDYEAYYTKEQIWENLLRDKALLTVVENAVRIE